MIEAGGEERRQRRCGQRLRILATETKVDGRSWDSRRRSKELLERRRDPLPPVEASRLARAASTPCNSRATGRRDISHENRKKARIPRSRSSWPIVLVTADAASMALTRIRESGNHAEDGGAVDLITRSRTTCVCVPLMLRCL